MNWDAIGAIAETLGAIGVIVSVIYLGYQIRVGSKTVQRSNAHQLNVSAREWWGRFQTHPQIPRLWIEGMHDFSGLSSEDALRFSTLLLDFLTTQEELFYAREDHELPEWSGHVYEIGMRDSLANPGFREFWTLRRHWFSERFRAHIDDLIEQGPVNEQAPWYKIAED